MRLQKLMSVFGTCVGERCAWHLWILLVTANIQASHAQSITWIGLPNDNRYGPALSFFANVGGLSEDGSILVQASDQPVAYYWKRFSGWNSPGGFLYNFADTSSNGSILVGIAPLGTSTYSQPAYYNMDSGQWYALGLPNGYRSGYILSTSQDGTVFVGSLSLDTGGAAAERPFRWQNGSYTLLSIPADNPRLVYAVAVSPDGAVTVGTAAYEDTVPFHALRWDGTTMTILPKLDSQAPAWATDVSSQGRVIVGGIALTSGIFMPVRWDDNNIQPLPLGSFWSGTAHCVSRTGQVVTGSAFDPSFETGTAVRWSACGFENLNVAYSGLLNSGDLLGSAHMLTQSGRFIAGLGLRGTSTQLYILDTGKCWDPAGNVDADCCVDDADLLQVLFDFGQTGQGRPTDLNCDGVVDDADLLIVLFNFGSGC